MVIWKSELSRGILYFVRPAFRFLEQVTAGTFQDIIAAKRKSGYNIDVVKRYSATANKLAAEIEKEGHKDVADELRTVAELVCVMLDQELYWTPRWHNIALSAAKEEGLLEKTHEPE